MRFWMRSPQVSFDVAFNAESLSQASEIVGRLIDEAFVTSFENRNFGELSYVTVLNWGSLREAMVSFELFDEVPGRYAVESDDDWTHVLDAGA